MARFFVIFVLSFSGISLSAQWVSRPLYVMDSGDTLRGGRYLESWSDEQLAIFGNSRQVDFIGLMGIIRKSNGKVVGFQTVPLDSGSQFGEVVAVYPGFDAYAFHQYRMHSSGNFSVYNRYSLYRKSDGKCLGDFNQISGRGEPFSDGEDTLIWNTSFGDVLTLSKLNGDTSLSLSWQNIPEQLTSEDHLEWMEIGDSLYVSIQTNGDTTGYCRISSVHKQSLSWGKTRELTLTKNDRLISLDDSYKIPFAIMRNSISLDSVMAIAKHKVEIKPLGNVEPINFQIRNFYIPEQLGWLQGSSHFVYFLDIEVRGNFILVKTDYQPSQMYSYTKKRIILLDRQSRLYYDKLIHNGADIFIPGDIHLDRQGMVYCMYSDWTNEDYGVIKIGLDGRHFFLEDTPRENGTFPQTLSIFPNPARGYFRIGEVYDFPDGSEILIYNISGQLHYTQKIQGISPKVDRFYPINPGLYVLRVIVPEVGERREIVLFE